MLSRLSRAVLTICAAGIGGAVLLGIAAAFWVPSDAVGLAQMAGFNRRPNDKAPNELPPPEPPIRKPTQIIGDKRFLANDAITAVAVSPDGKILAAGMQSFPHPDPVILWNAVTGEEVGRLTEHEGMTNRMTFSPDGALLYTGGHSTTLSLGRADDLLRVWDVASRKLIRNWQADDWTLTPDGHTVASVDSHHAINDWGGDPVPSDFTARVWDTRTWKELWSHHEVGEMASIAITPDGRYVACGGVYDNTIHIWDRLANKELKKLKNKDWDGSIYLLSFSPDGHILAAASVSAMVPRPFVLWDWTSGEELYRFRDRAPFHLAFTPDGKSLLTSEGNGCRVWDVADGSEDPPLKVEGNGRLTQFSFSADGKRVYIAKERPHPLIYDLASRKEVAPDPPFSGRPVTLPFELANPLPSRQDYNADVHLPDGSVMHNNMLDGGWGIRHINRPGGKTIQEFIPDWASVFTCSPDGKVLATFGHEVRLQGVRDSAIHLWDVDTGRSMGTIAGEIWAAHWFQFSPDSSKLAVAGQDGMIRLWDVASRKPLLRLDPDKRPAGYFVFSKDGRFLVGGTSVSPTVLIWDVALPGRNE